ncbi:GrpB family protein [Jannaschia sp. S6380]|uniref:GrpB family protein n=1 Tax=Jannaschia sp. S6380 TaxID=2926408 RepID=UPI001FF47028|nr:GrpB family protein [Jannaschia sp. S6380]MCK0168906.1 GrpB family protein [Jannaschia sp. S6380]
MSLVVPPDPDWSCSYAREAARLAQHIPTLHHIGSTAVPGLSAKPTIDILGVLPDAMAVDEAVPALTRLSYDDRGESGLPGRRFLRLMDGPRRLVHLHLWPEGAPAIHRHLAFRDWLRAFPDRAAAYGAHKLALAARPGRTRADYVADKDAFVRAAEAEALDWAATHDSHRLRRR